MNFLDALRIVVAEPHVKFMRRKKKPGELGEAIRVGMDDQGGKYLKEFYWGAGQRNIQSFTPTALDYLEEWEILEDLR